MKNLTGVPILATFLPPQNHQNPQQQKFIHFSNEHSRSRGVEKNHFWHSHAAWGSLFFLIPMQRGNAKSYFCDTSPARMRFFLLLPHVPSGKLKNHENAILESMCRRHVVNYKNRKSF